MSSTARVQLGVCFFSSYNFTSRSIGDLKQNATFLSIHNVIHECKIENSKGLNMLVDIEKAFTSIQSNGTLYHLFRKIEICK